LNNTYGWTHERQREFAPFSDMGLVPARVIIQQRELWHAKTLDGQAYEAGLIGKFRHDAAQGDFPVAGDWVTLEVTGSRARIHHVLPRQGTLIRKAAGSGTLPQIIAANIDLGLLVCALNEDFNPRRLERYIALCRSGKIEPLIVLTKLDLIDDLEPFLSALDQVAKNIAVIAVSVVNRIGLPKLQSWLVSGHTAALLGSSGAGKSTLLNALAGHDLMATSDVRISDGRGQHTTTHRELVTLDGGAMILDSPGMRELALWEGAVGIGAAFEDIEALAARCRFANCQHHTEPDCAVQNALLTEELDPKRLAAFLKLRREQAYEEAKGNPVLQAQNKKMWKQRNANYIATMRLRDRTTS
jgi:ribosome biogenesis GTPase / thiamine phosphate phosphatase